MSSDGLVWTDAPDPKHVYPPIAECIRAGHSTNGVNCAYGFCGRCSGHVDNGHQGHYWKFCQVTKSLREFHFCCPDACEMEVKADA
jgi:hypothetical protein